MLGGRRLVSQRGLVLQKSRKCVWRRGLEPALWRCDDAGADHCTPSAQWLRLPTPSDYLLWICCMFVFVLSCASVLVRALLKFVVSVLRSPSSVRSCFFNLAPAAFAIRLVLFVLRCPSKCHGTTSVTGCFSRSVTFQTARGWLAQPKQSTATNATQHACRRT